MNHLPINYNNNDLNSIIIQLYELLQLYNNLNNNTELLHSLYNENAKLKDENIKIKNNTNKLKNENTKLKNANTKLQIIEKQFKILSEEFDEMSDNYNFLKNEYHNDAYIRDFLKSPKLHKQLVDDHIHNTGACNKGFRGKCTKKNCTLAHNKAELIYLNNSIAEERERQFQEKIINTNNITNK